MTCMSEIEAASLAKPMPACVSSYAIRGDSMSTDMQYGVRVESTE